jgi:CHASE3 domain sensor protein
MVKKVILGIGLFGLVGILVGGAVLRTLDKTRQSSESHGSQAHGRSAQSTRVSQEVRQAGGQRNRQDQERPSGVWGRTSHR